MGRGKQLDRPPRLGHARLVKAVREAPAATEHVERGQPLPHLGHGLLEADKVAESSSSESLARS